VDENTQHEANDTEQQSTGKKPEQDILAAMQSAFNEFIQSISQLLSPRQASESQPSVAPSEPVAHEEAAPQDDGALEVEPTAFESEPAASDEFVAQAGSTDEPVVSQHDEEPAAEVAEVTSEVTSETEASAEPEAEEMAPTEDESAANEPVAAEPNDGTSEEQVYQPEADADESIAALAESQSSEEITAQAEEGSDGSGAEPDAVAEISDADDDVSAEAASKSQPEASEVETSEQDDSPELAEAATAEIESDVPVGEQEQVEESGSQAFTDDELAPVAELDSLDAEFTEAPAAFVVESPEIAADEEAFTPADGVTDSLEDASIAFADGAASEGEETEDIVAEAEPVEAGEYAAAEESEAEAPAAEEVEGTFAADVSGDDDTLKAVASAMEEPVAAEEERNEEPAEVIAGSDATVGD